MLITKLGKSMMQKLKCENLTKLMTELTRRVRATKADLVRRTTLSSTTVSDSLNSLVRNGLVRTAGMMNSDGGRRATIYEINPEYGTFVGVDITNDSISFALTDAASNLISFEKVPVKADIPVITVLMDRLAGFKSPLAIGLGLDGEIDYRNQIVVSAPGLKWEMVHLKEIIERLTLSFVQVDHRSNGAALYEGVLGNASKLSSYACLFRDCPDKLSIVIDDFLLRGVGCFSGKGFGSALTAVLDSLSLEAFISDIQGIEWIKKITVETKPSRMAEGMAFAARSGWVKSIYFLL